MIALWIKKLGLFAQGGLVCLCGVGMLALIFRILFSRLPTSNTGIFILLAISSLVLAFVGIYYALFVFGAGVNKVCEARELESDERLSARLPMEGTLVRAALAPPIDQPAELLRSAHSAQETPKEQLLRTTQGEHG